MTAEINGASTQPQFEALDALLDVRNLASVKETYTDLCSKHPDLSEFIRARIEKQVRFQAIQFGSRENVTVEEIQTHLNFVISLAKEDLCSKILTVTILQDIFDVSSVRKAEELFAVVEEAIVTWKTPFFFDSCKNNVLRMCNDLLKRLSQTVDTTFCGRILILLAKALPLNERSGLNLMSQFNINNVTTFDQQDIEMKEEVKQKEEKSLKKEKEETKEESEKKEDSEEKEEKVEKEEGETEEEEDMEIGEIRDQDDLKIDYELYVKFWKLQDFFVNPTQAYNQEKWLQFENNLSDVLSIFAENKLEKPRDEEKQTIAEPELNGDHTQINGINSTMTNGVDCEMQGKKEDEFGSFSAKYLTNQKLFSLQIADSQFRRYFLTQVLILIQYLQNPNVKSRDPVLFMTPTQEKTVNDWTDRVYQLIKETYPHGAYFAESLKKLLKIDKTWSNWKNDGCPDLVAQNVVEEKLVQHKRKEVDSYDPEKVDLGNIELTRLWNIDTNNLNSCTSKNRIFNNVLETILDEVLDEIDPDSGIEEQYMKLKDERYQWMCSRYLLYNNYQHYMKSSGLFPTNNAIKNEPMSALNHLKYALLNAAKDIEKYKQTATEIEERLLKEHKRQADEAKARAEAKKAKEEAEAKKAAEAKAKEAAEAKAKEKEAAEEKAKAKAATQAKAKADALDKVKQESETKTKPESKERTEAKSMLRKLISSETKKRSSSSDAKRDSSSTEAKTSATKKRMNSIDEKDEPAKKKVVSSETKARSSSTEARKESSSTEAKAKAKEDKESAEAKTKAKEDKESAEAKAKPKKLTEAKPKTKDEKESAEAKVKSSEAKKAVEAIKRSSSKDARKDNIDGEDESAKKKVVSNETKTRSSSSETKTPTKKKLTNNDEKEEPTKKKHKHEKSEKHEKTHKSEKTKSSKSDKSEKPSKIRTRSRSRSPYRRPSSPPHSRGRKLTK